MLIFNVENLKKNGRARRNLDQILLFTHRQNTSNSFVPKPRFPSKAQDLFKELEQGNDAAVKNIIEDLATYCIETINFSAVLKLEEKNRLLDKLFDNPAADTWYKWRYIYLILSKISILSLGPVIMFMLQNNKEKLVAKEQIISFESFFSFSALVYCMLKVYTSDSQLNARISESTYNFTEWLNSFASELDNLGFKDNSDLEYMEDYNPNRVRIAQAIVLEENVVPVATREEKENIIRQVRDIMYEMFPSENKIDRYQIDYLLSSRQTRHNLDKIILFLDKHSKFRDKNKDLVLNATQFFLMLKSNESAASSNLQNFIEKFNTIVQNASGLQKAQRDALIDLIFLNPSVKQYTNVRNNSLLIAGIITAGCIGLLCYDKKLGLGALYAMLGYLIISAGVISIWSQVAKDIPAHENAAHFKILVNEIVKEIDKIENPLPDYSKVHSKLTNKAFM